MSDERDLYDFPGSRGRDHYYNAAWDRIEKAVSSSIEGLICRESLSELVDRMLDDMLDAELDERSLDASVYLDDQIHDDLYEDLTHEFMPLLVRDCDCGATAADLVMYEPHGLGSQGTWSVTCCKCLRRSPQRYAVLDAVRSWNTGASRRRIAPTARQ